MPTTTDPGAAEDLRLARLHLRLGMVEVALAELEDLDGRGALDRAGLAALAEARWRTGDLAAAEEAAQRHLEAAGDDTIALVVAAEAAAAGGRPAEAQDLMGRVGPLDPSTLDVLFAGLPRRAYWPAGHEAPAGQAAPASPPEAASAAATEAAARRASSLPSPAEVLAASAGLWDAETVAQAGGPGGPSSPTSAAAPTWVAPARAKGHADPEVELEVAREELAAAPQRGLLRMALVLRLDPTLAPEVLDALRLRRESEALIIRGDAQRLLGRHLEAEAEFADAAEAVEREAIASGRPSGGHAPREDS